VFTHESGKVIGVCGGRLCAADAPTPNSEFHAVPGKSEHIGNTSAIKSQPKTPVSKSLCLKPSVLAVAAAAVQHDDVAATPSDLSEAAAGLKQSIVPQTLHFSQVSAGKTPDSATKRLQTSVLQRSAAAAATNGRSHPDAADTVEQPHHAELPIAFSLYADNPPVHSSHAFELLAFYV
jgi:hypothetical protein